MSREDFTPRVAIAMGDPAGIGPEIILKAARRLQSRIANRELSILITGTRAAIETAGRFVADPIEIPTVDERTPETWPALALVDVAPEAGDVPLGQVSAGAGLVAFRAAEKAVRLTEAGHASSIVTAPLNKEALNLAGHHYAGYTDMLARLTGTEDSVMLLLHGNTRVSHVSTHVALRDVPSRLTPKRLRLVIRLTHEACVGFGLTSPRIAVAALNPHSGEGGIFGREDIDITAPVVDEFRVKGWRVEGPVAGDIVFVRALGGQYDAVVAMYHDQGHIPVKMQGFHMDPATGRYTSLSGVNVTLGLPIVRTSVDHGTAFDIAGKGIANEDSLLEAIDVALQLSAQRAAAAAQPARSS